ncbi:MAG: DUF2812 domain-containing protein [Lachnospiraceae bacterium]|nr:DUF2812 domain-containing protein [Lachnospiraceae bacterium]
MSKDYKTSYKVYTAWNYEKEIEDLNRASAEGWQLIKGGCFHSRFKRNEHIQYRYQLDYPGTIEDMGRYIETFHEQGWEYINSTFNGWHYFRKLYDPSLPEEEYEIFTDHSSLKEMNGHWVKLASILCGIIGVATIFFIIEQIFHPNLPHFVSIITNILILAVFARGIIIMKDPDKKKNINGDSYIFLALILFLVIGNGANLFLTSQRPFYNSVYAGDTISPISNSLEDGIEWTALPIKYKDNYYMDLTITADAPICFTLINEAKEIIYTVKESSFEETDVKLPLEKGEYKIILSDFEGGAVSITADID